MDGELGSPRRRRRSGFLLPGILLTVLTCLGVIALIASATGVLPDEVPILRAAGGGKRRAIVATAQPTATRPPAPRPSSAPPATSGPTVAPTGSSGGPTTGPTRRPGEPTTGPTGGGTGGGGGPTSGPATTPPSPKPPAPKPQPPAPTCKAGSATVTAVADAYVDQNAPTTNFGGSGTNQVTSRDKERNRRTLVRFALPAVPKGCTVTGGTLTLTARDATGRRIVVNRASRAWDEGSVTWASAPATTGSGTTATVSGPSVAWSLSAATVTGAAYGFVLRDAAENAQGSGFQTGFASRSGAGAPTLTVRWA